MLHRQFPRHTNRHDWSVCHAVCNAVCHAVVTLWFLTRDIGRDRPCDAVTQISSRTVLLQAMTSSVTGHDLVSQLFTDCNVTIPHIVTVTIVTNSETPNLLVIM